MMQPNVPKYTLDPRPPRPPEFPFWMKAGVAVSVTLSWIPLALIARARFSFSTEPRVSFIQDMGTQPKYREQQSSEVFADGRADRQPIPGTVARGNLQADDHYYRGYKAIVGAQPGQPGVQFFDTFPDQVKVSPELLHRGQERFNIYCTPCHGYDGAGHGVVSDRGLELSKLSEMDSTGAAHPQATWVQAADLRIDPARGRAIGHIFNTINVGIRSMPAYGPQIPIDDRWAIVAYVRALQLSQNAPQ